MSTLDTALAGSPASITAVAEYLRNVYSPAVSQFADNVFACRRNLAQAWQGEASDACGGRLKELGNDLDSSSDGVRRLSYAVDTLAGSLQAALNRLTAARDLASAAGLVVSGTLIHSPGPAPAPVPALVGDTTPAVRAARRQAFLAVKAYANQVSIWEQANDLVTDAFQLWSTAMDDFATAWNSSRGDIVGTAADLFSGAAGAFSLENQALRLRSQAMLYQQMHDTATANLAEAVDPATGKLYPTRDWFYKDTDTARLSQKVVDTTNDALNPRNLKVGEGVARASLALGVVATGYGIYADIQDGKPADEAVASNVGGAAAGAAAGWATTEIVTDAAVGLGAAALEGTTAGAALGSVVPVVGTVVGAVVGAGVGIIVSGAIDDWFESEDADSDDGN